MEPGIYFNPVLLKPALSNPKQKKFLVKSQIQEYLSFGGETASLVEYGCGRVCPGPTSRGRRLTGCLFVCAWMIFTMECRIYLHSSGVE